MSEADKCGSRRANEGMRCLYPNRSSKGTSRPRRCSGGSFNSLYHLVGGERQATMNAPPFADGEQLGDDLIEGEGTLQ